MKVNHFGLLVPHLEAIVTTLIGLLSTALTWWEGKVSLRKSEFESKKAKNKLNEEICALENILQ